MDGGLLLQVQRGNIYLTELAEGVEYRCLQNKHQGLDGILNHELLKTDRALSDGRLFCSKHLYGNLVPADRIASLQESVWACLLSSSAS